MAAAIVLALFPLGAARAEDRVNMTQLSGADNVAAALAWSTHAFPEPTNNAVLGRSDLPPDNLASGLLQGVLEAPLLLTASNSLDDAVLAELERLEVRTVHILGGLSAISAAVESELRSEGFAVRRYSGTTRIETAQAIAQQHAGAATTALLARAFGTSADPTSAWADALAGGAWAADDSFPVLFTQTETLTASTRQYLQTSRIKTVTILGGTGAVSQAVEDALKAMGITVERVSGATRFATAIAIAKERGFDTAGDTDVTSIVLADGQNANGWAAGFTAAGYAADKPIVLSNGSALPAETDSWFAGAAAADKLVVAPYVTEAAAKAAADEMGLLKKAAVTLDATSFPNNGNITGKVTPMDDVKSVAVSGPCVTAGAVTPNATTGAFSIPVSQTFTPGSCALTFTVTYEDNSTQTNPFTITITGPGPNATVTNAPELVNVTFVSQTANHVLLRYTFDEQVSIADDAADPLLFAIYGFDGTRFPPVAPTGDDVRPDADTKSVLASYNRPEYERSTTAVVDAGAVKSPQTQRLNPEGSRGIQAIAFDAGRTAAPDLLSVSVQAVDRDTTAAEDPALRATFTFDKAATRVGTPAYVLTAGLADPEADVTEGENFNTSSYVSGDGTTTHVMDVTDAAWTTLALAQEALATIKRAHVPAGAVIDNSADFNGLSNLKLTVPVTGTSGTATFNSLVSVTLNDATDTVTYVFSAVPGTTATLENDGDQFFVYDHEGSITSGLEDPPAHDPTVNDKTVTVKFAAGVIDAQTTGGGYQTAAGVNNGFYETKAATNGAHTYASGSTLAPDLVSVTKVATSSPDPFGGSSVTEYTVTFTFNKKVAAVASGDFKSYDANGNGTPFNATGGEQCAVDPDATEKVVCVVVGSSPADANFEAVKNAVLFGIVQEAASTADPAGANAYASYPTSKVPSTS